MRKILLSVFIFLFLTIHAGYADEWVQTTQADFQSGTVSDVDILDFPGDIYLERELTSSDDFSDGNSTGWTEADGTWTVSSGAYNQTQSDLKIWQFGVTDVSGSDSTHLLYPYDAQKLSSGNYLITDQGNHRIIEVNSSGIIVWQFGVTATAGADDTHLNYPNAAQRLSSGNTLIADSYNHRILEVNSSGTKVWQFGVTGVSGSDDTHLNIPVDVDRRSNGNTVICDITNHRMLEVDSSGVKVWQFGETGVPDYDDEHLNGPSSVEALANGNVLIADKTNFRVIEVNETTGNVWEYIDNVILPTDAQRLANGNTLICGYNDYIIEVDTDGNEVWRFAFVKPFGATLPISMDTYLDRPRRASRTSDGTTLVVDKNYYRVIEVNTAGNYSTMSNTYDDYKLVAKVVQDSAVSYLVDGKMYTYFRYQDTKNFYVMEMNYKNDKVKFLKFKDNGFTLLGEEDYTLTAGTAYTVKLNILGSTFRGYINNTLVITSTDSDFTTGDFGFGTGTGVTGNFDDVALYGIYKTSGTYTSAVYDSGMIGTIWGTVSWNVVLPVGTSVTVNSRTGNTAVPDASWDSWSTAYTTSTGENITSSAAQYIQFRANLATTSNIRSPGLAEIKLASVTGIADVKLGPNPYNPKVDANFNLYYERTNDTIDAKIFTISGELVYEFARSEVLPTMIRWNGKNQKGETVASGFYILHIKTTSPFSGTETIVNKKFAVVK